MVAWKFHDSVMHRLCTAALLLFALLTRQSLSQRQGQSEEDSGCNLSREEVETILDGASRTWIVTDDVLEDHDIQDIIMCTDEGDTISLQTTQTIQPRSRGMIPWDLTFDGLIHGADETAVMTCPPGGGLFLVWSASVTLRNLVIGGCNLTETDRVTGILETDGCPEETNVRMALHLNQVNFTGNRNAGGSLLFFRTSECYTVAMQHVVFQANRYRMESLLSSSNDFEDIQLIGNQLLGPSRQTSLFYFPPASETTINTLSAENNNGTLFDIDRSNVSISNSTFLRNSASEKGLIFADESEVLLSSSLFDRNNDSYYIGCWGGSGRYDCGHGNIVLNKTNAGFVSTNFFNNSAPIGGAVQLNTPGDTIFLDCAFVSNSAFDSSLGGGAVSISSKLNLNPGGVTFMNCTFEKNFGGRHGGAILVTGFRAGLLIQDSKFLGNKAGSGGYSSGGAVSLRYSDFYWLRVNTSIFKSNSARDQGGAVDIQESSGGIRFDDSVFSLGTSQRGGAVFCNGTWYGLYLNFKNTRFKENKAVDDDKGLGGAVYAEHISSERITMDSCVFSMNTAEKDGGAFYGEDLQRIRIDENCRFIFNRVRTSSHWFCLTGPVNVRIDQNMSTVSNWGVGDWKISTPSYFQNDAWRGIDTSATKIAIDNCVSVHVNAE